MSQDLSSNQSISEVNKSLDDLKSKNIELVNLLSDAKLQLLALKEQVEKLGQPPSGFGIFRQAQPEQVVKLNEKPYKHQLKMEDSTLQM